MTSDSEQFAAHSSPSADSQAIVTPGGSGSGRGGMPDLEQPGKIATVQQPAQVKPRSTSLDAFGPMNCPANSVELRLRINCEYV
jgi:hypothetical protein